MLKSDVVERLKNIVGENSGLTAKEDVAAYAYDGTTTCSHPPDAAVLPATAKQISSILALAKETETLTEFRNGTENLHSFHFRQYKGGVG